MKKFMMLCILLSTSVMARSQKPIVVEIKNPNDKAVRISEDPKVDFHWSDEKDPTERQWLKENWDLKD